MKVETEAISDDQQEHIIKVFEKRRWNVICWVFIPMVVVILMGFMLAFGITPPFQLGYLFFPLFWWSFVGSIVAQFYLRCPNCNTRAKYATWATKPVWWQESSGGVELLTSRCVVCGVCLSSKVWKQELRHRELRKSHENNL